MAIRSNLYLDPVTNDLVVNGAYNLRLTEDIAEWLSAKLTIKLRMFAGEWFLDSTRGIPYYESILKKGVDVNEINALFLAAIANTDGVQEVLSFETEYDNTTRRYSVVFAIKMETGETIEGSATV